MVEIVYTYRGQTAKRQYKIIICALYGKVTVLSLEKNQWNLEIKLR